MIPDSARRGAPRTLQQPAGRVINATAPIRICDNGGWTDTWFARHGKVFNIAVEPAVEVQIFVGSGDEGRASVLIDAVDFDDRYTLDDNTRGRHPLLEAAIERAAPRDHGAIEVTVSSRVPPGASTGTSAAVAVALLGALERLAGRDTSAYEIASMAHRVETEALERQSGVQDQYCAALGGINFIEITDYPAARVTPISVADPIRWELERRLVLIYLGNSHDSSQVHELVIRGLEDAGPMHPPLEALRRAADAARQALLGGDFAALGRSMRENTDAQAALHPALVSAATWKVIGIAQSHRAIGWKVNGAGGEGGTLTVLSGDRTGERRAMIREIERQNPAARAIPIALSPRGLRVWEAESL